MRTPELFGCKIGGAFRRMQGCSHFLRCIPLTSSHISRTFLTIWSETRRPLHQRQAIIIDLRRVRHVRSALELIASKGAIIHLVLPAPPFPSDTHDVWVLLLE